jgi:hypothetical protein
VLNRSAFCHDHPRSASRSRGGSDVCVVAAYRAALTNSGSNLERVVLQRALHLTATSVSEPLRSSNCVILEQGRGGIICFPKSGNSRSWRHRKGWELRYKSRNRNRNRNYNHGRRMRERRQARRRTRMHSLWSAPCA